MPNAKCQTPNSKLAIWNSKFEIRNSAPFQIPNAEFQIPNSRLCTFLVLCLAAGLTARAADKPTYEDNVLPILRNKCLRCHSAEQPKADLNLSTFNGLIKGSGNGPVVEGGDPDNSRLFKAVSHTEQPFMPPNDKLPDPDIDLIRKWIAGGLLETSGSKAILSQKPKLDLALAAGPIGKPEGPPPMPVEVFDPDPQVVTDRASLTTAMAASPWAPLLAIGGQHQVLLYHTETLELVGVVPFPDGHPCDVKFSANGRLLVIGGGRAALKGFSVLWDITTGERLLTVGDDYDAVLATDISADQRFIAHGGPDRLVRIFSTSTGEMVHQIKKHTDWVTSVRFGPDGRLLATGDRNGGIHVWEAAVAGLVCTLDGHRDRITGLEWASTNILVSTSEDGSAKLWNTDEARQVKNWTAHGGGALALGRIPDGSLVTCGRDKQATLWNANGDRQKNFPFPGDLPSRVALGHDGQRVFGTDWNGFLYAWNVADGKEIGRFPLNPPPLTNQLAAAQHQVELAQQQLQTPQANFQAAQEDLARTQARIDQLRAEAGQAQSEPTKTELNKLLERKDTLEKTVAEARAKTDAATQALQAAQPSAIRWETKLAFSRYFRASQELRPDRQRHDQLLAELKSAQAQIQSTQAELQAARTAASSPRLPVLQQLQSIAQTAGSNFTTQTERLRARHQQAQSAGDQETVSNLKLALDELAHAQETALSRLAQAKQKLTLLDTEARAAAQKSAELAAALEKRLQAETAHAETLRQEADKLGQAVEAAQARAGQLKQQFETLKARSSTG